MIEPSREAAPDQPEPATGPVGVGARSRLAAAVRALGHATVRHDLDDDTATRLADGVEALVARVEVSPRRPRDADAWFRGFFPADVADGDELVHDVTCVVSGPDNPLGIGLRAWVDGDEVVSEVTLGPAHEGAPGRAHGGIVAAVFDDALGYLLTVHHIVAYTGQLEVRYLAATPVGVPLRVRSRIVGRRERRTTITAEARADGEVVATATGVFVSVSADGVNPGPARTP